jgi:AmmeMemoRadiSam system protein B
MAPMTTSFAAGAAIRPPSVAGSFYPASPRELTSVVDGLLARAGRMAGPADAVRGSVVGLLVPHAGLVYSGLVAALGWRRLAMTPGDPLPTVVILGTNHGAAWLDGVAAWESGAWRTPLGDLPIDADLAGSILELGPPFGVDRDAHRGEHSIEVQLPLLHAVAPLARIVPLSVAAGTGEGALVAGARLGALLAEQRTAGQPVVLAISSDMAHYPSSTDCAGVTAELLEPILRLDPVALADAERAVMTRGTPGLVCGMCGIQPTVLGLAALRALGSEGGRRLGVATSADAGGPTYRTVGYLAAAFTA